MLPIILGVKLVMRLSFKYLGSIIIEVLAQKYKQDLQRCEIAKRMVGDGRQFVRKKVTASSSFERLDTQQQCSSISLAAVSEVKALDGSDVRRFDVTDLPPVNQLMRQQTRTGIRGQSVSRKYRQAGPSASFHQGPCVAC